MKRIKDVLIGVIIGSMLFAMPAFAQVKISSISVRLNAVSVQLEGEPVEVNSILYQGSTYLPMRKVAELVGKDVKWEPKTMTANITTISVMEGDKMDANNILKTHIPAVDVFEIVNKTDKYDMLVFHNSNNDLGFKLIMYIDEEKGKMGEYRIIIDDVPFVSEEGRAYISKDYYKQTILPLIQ